MKKVGLLFISSIIIIMFVVQNLIKQKSVVSPLPDFLMFSKNNQVKTLELWFPSSAHAENIN